MKGTVVAFLSVAILGLYVVLGKLLLSSVHPTIIVLFNSLLFGGVLILALDLRRKIRFLRRQGDLKQVYLISFFYSLAPLLFLIGLGLTTATNSILIARAEVLLTSLFAILFLSDKTTFFQLGGMMAILAGIAVLATDIFTGLSFNLGDLLVFISALSFAIGTVLFRKTAGHIRPEIVVSLRNIFAASFIFVLSLVLTDLPAAIGSLAISTVAYLLTAAVVVTVVGQFLWYRSIRHADKTNMSLAGVLSPVIAILYAILFLGETLAYSQLVGGMLIIVGMFLVELHVIVGLGKDAHIEHLKMKSWPHL